MRSKRQSALKGKLINLVFKENVLSARILVSFFERTKGLIGASRDALPVLLLECSDIHTHLMAFPIDIAFINTEGEVMGVCLSLHCGARIRCEGAIAVLERPASKSGWVVPGEQIVRQTLQ